MTSRLLPLAAIAAALTFSVAAHAGKPAAATQTAAQSSRVADVQRATFMDGKLAVNLPKSLERAAGRMVAFNGETGGVVLAAQPRPVKQTPADFLAMFEADNRKIDPSLKVLDKSEIKVGNLTLQKIELTMKDDELGDVYLMSAFGLSSGRVFTIGITADAKDQQTWAKRAKDILQSLTEA